MAGPIRISILANASQAKREITGVGKEAESSASRAKKAIIGLATGFIAFEAIHKVTDVLKESVAEAREAQKIGAQTTAVIKSTGGAANVTAGHVHDLADEIGRSTGQNADMIQSNENLLLTFKGIQNQVGKGNAIFDRATQTVTDMSVALGQSGKSSAIQLGKALNDPIKGLTALSRVGVQFNAQQTKQIKGLVDSGHQLGAQKIILKELTSEFGGSAAAQATAGDKLKETWREVEEEIGQKLLPILDKVETCVAEHLPEWMDKAGSAVDKVHSAFERVEPAIEAVINFLKKNPDTVKTFALVLGILLVPIIAVTGAMAALDAVLAINPFVLAAIALAALAAALKYAYDHSTTFHRIVDAAFTGVRLVIEAVWKVVQPIFELWVLEVKALGAIARWLWNNAFRPALTLILNVLGVLMNVWAKMLSALGHVPGFGWAKDAANVMQDAADAAKHIADNLHTIPSTTNATVVLRVIEGVVHTTGGHVPLDTSNQRSQKLLGTQSIQTSKTVHITVNAPVGSDGYTIGESVKGYLDTYLNGVPA